MASWLLPLFEAAEPQAQPSSQSECREARYLDHHSERIFVLLQSSGSILEVLDPLLSLAGPFHANVRDGRRSQRAFDS